MEVALVWVLLVTGVALVEVEVARSVPAQALVTLVAVARLVLMGVPGYWVTLLQHAEVAPIALASVLSCSRVQCPVSACISNTFADPDCRIPTPHGSPACYWSMTSEGTSRCLPFFLLL